MFTSRPVNRALYTELFTDMTESGKYVRNAVRTDKPKVWSKISEQLFDLGYQFPEMNEVVSGDFPTALIDRYQAPQI